MRVIVRDATQRLATEQWVVPAATAGSFGAAVLLSAWSEAEASDPGCQTDRQQGLVRPRIAKMGFTLRHEAAGNFD